MVVKPGAAKPRVIGGRCWRRPAARRGLLPGGAGPSVDRGPAGRRVATPRASPRASVWLNWEGSGVAQFDGNTKSPHLPGAAPADHGRERGADHQRGHLLGQARRHEGLRVAAGPLGVGATARRGLRAAQAGARPAASGGARPIRPSDFFPRGVEQYRYRNGLWGLPRDFPNRELPTASPPSRRRGSSPPLPTGSSPDWTWDVFLDAARRLTKPDGAQWGFNTGRSIRTWAVWVWSNGGEVIDEQKLVCTLDQAPAVEGLQFLQDLIHRHRVWPETLPQGASFQGGQVAIQENAPAGMGNLRRDIGDKFAWDVVMHPRGKNGKYVAAGGGAGWAVDAATGGQGRDLGLPQARHEQRGADPGCASWAARSAPGAR